jgi:glycosyltransferase involved in cell wall biosynthesis
LHVTVAICTWNRCRLLQQTLEGLTRVAIPDQADWDLLVVDNNSNDDTDEVVRSFEQRLPVRRVFEPVPGLSKARNRVVAEAVGDYILWTDDDVTVCTDWLTSYVDAFRKRPDAALFGGPIEPCFDGRPPKWLTQIYPTVTGAYAARELGSEPIPFVAPSLIPWGANYATRAREQRMYRYDPELGYRPDSLMAWEETEVIVAMLRDGLQGEWVPRARVRHHIPTSRQTTAYLRTYFYNQGRYVGRKGDVPYRRLVFGRPPWLVKQAVKAELQYRLHRLLSKPEVWVQHLIASSEKWGTLREFKPRQPPERSSDAGITVADERRPLAE